ncbi:MAG: TetR/AcrR family transcriptional regulator [Cyanobacteriota bacterium]
MAATHSQNRRLEVTEAAWRVIVREGLDRASMRAIAQELGCTTGVVTHYFRDKQELTLFALQQVTERLLALMESQPKGTGLDRLLQLLLVFLPWDPERQAIVRVWLAFLGYAVGRPELMAEHQHCSEALEHLVAEEIRQLQKTGDIRPELDPDLEAQGLLALVDGLAIRSVIQGTPLAPEQYQALLRRYVQSL